MVFSTYISRSVSIGWLPRVLIDHNLLFKKTLRKKKRLTQRTSALRQFQPMLHCGLKLFFKRTVTEQLIGVLCHVTQLLDRVSEERTITIDRMDELTVGYCKKQTRYHA